MSIRRSAYLFVAVCWLIFSNAAMSADTAFTPPIDDAIASGNWKELQKSALSWNKEQPDNPAAKLILSFTYYMDGDYENRDAFFPALGGGKTKSLKPKLIGRLDTLLKKFPDNADVRFLAGLSMVRMSMEARGRKLLLESLKINPENSVAWNNLAISHLGWGEKEPHKANGYIEKAVFADPAYAEGLSNKAYLLARSKNFSEAAEVQRKAVEASKSHKDIYLYNLAVYLHLDNQKEESKKILKEMGKYIPEKAVGRSTTGTVVGNGISVVILGFNEQNIRYSFK